MRCPKATRPINHLSHVSGLFDCRPGEGIKKMKRFERFAIDKGKVSIRVFDSDTGSHYLYNGDAEGFVESFDCPRQIKAEKPENNVQQLKDSIFNAIVEEYVSVHGADGNQGIFADGVLKRLEKLESI